MSRCLPHTTKKLFSSLFKRIFFDPKTFFSLLVASISLLSPTQTLAFSRSSYFDWGPYYEPPKQVLGATYSNIENLPNVTKPADMPKYTSPGVMPGSPFAFFDTLAENVQLTFTFDPVARENLRLSFANERIAEINTLISQDKPQLASVAVDNYETLMKDVAADLPALAKSANPNAANTLNAVQTNIAAQNVTLQDLSFTTPPKMTETIKDALSTTEKTMDALADAKNEPSIPDELSASIQKLKEQGLITPEETNKLYNYDSRHEVRRELDKLVSSGQFPATEELKMDEAVNKSYPDAHKEIVADYTLMELRSYETRQAPSEAVLAQINTWKKQADNVPPPQEIRPYLYYERAQALAQNVDLTKFPPTISAEAAKFYPEAISENPTYSAPPAGTPTATTEASPLPSLAPGESPLPVASPAPQASVTPPSVKPYLSEVSGPVPGDATYFLKSFGETISWATTFDSAKRVELEMRFSEERLREASKLAQDPKRQKDYIISLGNYQDSVKKASESLANFKGNDEVKEDLALKLESETSRHNVVLEKGFLPPPSEKTELIAQSIATTENALDTSADTLDRPAMPEALVDRLQDLKAQGLVLPEEVTDITKADNRSQVREKIRKLSEMGSFPPADAKKLDEAQNLTSPLEYNQLVEVRKVEELQRLRAIQAEFAQTATLKATNASYEQRLAFLENTIDPALLNKNDLAGREDWKKVFDELATATRPINSGQFPVASPAPPERTDAVLTTCPIGAVFKQSEGCVWEDNGKKINDYEQYKCSQPGQYWSFAAKACVTAEQTRGNSFPDGQPLCPQPYAWNWSTHDCQLTTGGPPPSFAPWPSASPGSEDEIAKQVCPEGATYTPPRGCVWNNNNEPVRNYRQYECREEKTYYSFTQGKCVPMSDGTFNQNEAQPSCQTPGNYWSWSEGRCVPEPSPFASPTGIAEVTVPTPTLISPDSPFYFLDRAVEAVQSVVALTPQAREETRLAIAKERFAEAYTMLENKKPDMFKTALADYTGTMQQVYNDLAGNINLSTEAKKSLGEKLADQVVEQNVILQREKILADDKELTPISAAVSTTVQGLDRAADLQGESPIPPEIQAKIDSLPPNALTDEQKKSLADADTRIEGRLAIGKLVGMAGIDTNDAAVFDKTLTEADPKAYREINQLSAIKEIATLKDQTEKLTETIQKTETITEKLDKFNKTYEVGGEIPAEIRPYIRLTRIDDVAQTIRPDIIKIEDFGNRRDIQLAVATLQQEYKPTRSDFEKVENYRRNNPGRALPPELARIEGLSYSLGVRDRAESCLLPSPPFSPNTPCPAPGAAIPVFSYYTSNYPATPGFSQRYYPPTSYGYPGASPTSGEALTYGKGPEATSPGVCQNGYHWMYDSGGWCMSNSGNYSSTNAYQASYGGGGSGYTPYSPYYSATGVPPGTIGYQGPGTYTSPGYYTPPSYYGPAPTAYSTNPPPGTVPGTGPAPTASGGCPAGFHWMPPTGSQSGWCMADGGTYVPGSAASYYAASYPTGTTTSSTPPAGGYNCGGRPYDPATGRCQDGACPGGFNWNGSQCVSTGGYSPNLTQSSCGPGYYWDGRGCLPTTTGGSYYSGWSGSSCTPPSTGCGSGQYWDGGTCSCRSSSSTPYNGYTTSSANCTYPSGGCSGSGAYFDWGTCSCRTNTPGSCTAPSWGCGSGSWNSSTCSCQYSGSSGGSSYGGSCSPPSGGCGYNSWYDYSTCACRSSSYTPSSGSGGSTSTSTSTSGCSYPSGGCGSGWFDWSSCSCRSSSSTSTSTSTSTSGSGGSTSSGSCPSGYHWMSDGGGWCMSDGGSGGGSSSTTTTTTTTTTSEPTPQQSNAPAPAPAESTAPAPAPSG